MKKRTLLIAAVVFALTATLASTATAKKPENPGKPPAEPVAAPSCQERVDIYGAVAWNLADHDAGSDTYTAAVPACIDVTEDVHLRDDQGNLRPVRWLVTVTGEASRFKGLKLVFEQGVHGTVFAETIVGADDASVDPVTGNYVFDDAEVWAVTVTPTGEPLSFVAMPRNGDKWVTDPIVTIAAQRDQ